jgi:hypothetical protein
MLCATSQVNVKRRQVCASVHMISQWKGMSGLFKCHVLRHTARSHAMELKHELDTRSQTQQVIFTDLLMCHQKLLVVVNFPQPHA